MDSASTRPTTVNITTTTIVPQSISTAPATATSTATTAASVSATAVATMSTSSSSSSSSNSLVPREIVTDNMEHLLKGEKDTQNNVVRIKNQSILVSMLMNLILCGCSLQEKEDNYTTLKKEIINVLNSESVKTTYTRKVRAKVREDIQAFFTNGAPRWV